MFKGICNMDRDVVTEIAPAMSAGVRKFYYRMAAIGCAVLWIFFFIEAASANNETRFVMILINIAIMLFFVWVVKRSIKKGYGMVVEQFMGQVKKAYYTESIAIPMEFRDDKMCMMSVENQNEFPLSDVEKVFETETQVVMQMSNNLYMWIEKSSLEGGTVEEFKKFLETYSKNR